MISTVVSSYCPFRCNPLLCIKHVQWTCPCHFSCGDPRKKQRPSQGRYPRKRSPGKTSKEAISREDIQGSDHQGRYPRKRSQGKISKEAISRENIQGSDLQGRYPRKRSPGKISKEGISREDIQGSDL